MTRFVVKNTIDAAMMVSLRRTRAQLRVCIDL